MANDEIRIPKVWRSEIPGVFLFLALCSISIYISNQFPSTIIDGRLFGIGDWELRLALPIFWLMPFIAIGSTVAKIYDVRYTINQREIQAIIGILAFNKRITGVRYEDVRSVEIEQTLLGRIFNFGDVEISTAATGTVEIIFRGIESPTEVQDMLQRERSNRREASRRAGMPGNHASA